MLLTRGINVIDEVQAHVLYGDLLHQVQPDSFVLSREA